MLPRVIQVFEVAIHIPIDDDEKKYQAPTEYTMVSFIHFRDGLENSTMSAVAAFSERTIWRLLKAATSEQSDVLSGLQNLSPSRLQTLVRMRIDYKSTPNTHIESV